MDEIITFLNQNAGAIQGISTVVLVAVTIWYAISTKKMSDLMKSQITSKILIENILLGTSFWDDYFLTRKFSKNQYFNFKIIFDVRNEGNASGSIYKPSIEISSTNYQKAFILNPKTKDYEEYNHKQIGMMQSYDTRVIDYGTVIFLQGGDSNKIELEYKFSIKNDEDLKFVEEVQKKLDSFECYFLTKDNMGKEYKIKIDNISKEDGFGLR
jgi:hypothetical protein